MCLFITLILLGLYLACIVFNSKVGIYSYFTVALTETFPLLRALLNLLKESLGRNKPATNLSTRTSTHCVGFLLYPSLT
jgi:hypothetical protein